MYVHSFHQNTHTIQAKPQAAKQEANNESEPYKKESTNAAQVQLPNKQQAKRAPFRVLGVQGFDAHVSNQAIEKIFPGVAFIKVCAFGGVH